METMMRQMPTNLNITYDPAFKVIFGEDKESATGLIEAYFDIKVEKLEFLDKEKISLGPDLKQMRADIIVAVNDTIFIDIEMQKQKTKSDFYRAYYYRCSLAVSEIKQGDDYDKYRFHQIFISGYDWKVGDIVIPEATILERTEQGITFHDLSETKYISLNSAKDLVEKDIDDFARQELWTFYINFRHEDEMRDKIEEVIMRDKNLKRIDDKIVKLEKDNAFMLEMADKIDKACDEMDLRDAESARQEAKESNEKFEKEHEEKEEERKAKEMYKKEAEKQKQNNEYLTLCMQYMEEGHSAGEAKELARKALDTKVVN